MRARGGRHVERSPGRAFRGWLSCQEAHRPLLPVPPTVGARSSSGGTTAAPEPGAGKGVYVHIHRARRGGIRAAEWGQGGRRSGDRRARREPGDPRDNPGQGEGEVAAAGTGG